MKTIKAENQFSNEDRLEISDLYSEIYQPEAQGDLLTESTVQEVDPYDTDISQFELGDGVVVKRTGPDQNDDYTFKISGLRLDLGNNYTDDHFVDALAGSEKGEDINSLIRTLNSGDDVTISFKGNFGMDKEGYVVNDLAAWLSQAYERKMIEAEQADYSMEDDMY